MAGRRFEGRLGGPLERAGSILPCGSLSKQPHARPGPLVWNPDGSDCRDFPGFLEKCLKDLVLGRYCPEVHLSKRGLLLMVYRRANLVPSFSAWPPPKPCVFEQGA